MEVFISLVGLTIAILGVYLSWHEKGQGIWATYIFGFLLVLTGGPLSSSISKFTVSPQSGLEVSFLNDDSISDKIQTEAALKNEVVPLTLKTKNPRIKKKVDNKKEVKLTEVKELNDYVKNMGMYPVPPSEQSTLNPGALVKIDDQGNFVVWASRSEAFDKSLEISVSAVASPQFQLEGTIDDKDSGNLKSTMVAFECAKGATIESTSFYGLSSNIKKLPLNLTETDDIFVVQSVLMCDGLKLDSKIMAKTNYQDINEKVLNYRYSSQEKVALGAKIVRLRIKKAKL